MEILLLSKIPLNLYSTTYMKILFDIKLFKQKLLRIKIWFNKIFQLIKFDAIELKKEKKKLNEKVENIFQDSM